MVHYRLHVPAQFAAALPHHMTKTDRHQSGHRCCPVHHPRPRAGSLLVSTPRHDHRSISPLADTPAVHYCFLLTTPSTHETAPPTTEPQSWFTISHHHPDPGPVHYWSPRPDTTIGRPAHLQTRHGSSLLRPHPPRAHDMAPPPPTRSRWFTISHHHPEPGPVHYWPPHPDTTIGRTARLPTRTAVHYCIHTTPFAQTPTPPPPVTEPHNISSFQKTEIPPPAFRPHWPPTTETRPPTHRDTWPPVTSHTPSHTPVKVHNFWHPQDHFIVILVPN